MTAESDKNPNKAFCFAYKESIDQNIRLNANIFLVCGKVLEISKYGPGKSLKSSWIFGLKKCTTLYVQKRLKVTITFVSR